MQKWYFSLLRLSYAEIPGEGTTRHARRHLRPHRWPNANEATFSWTFVADKCLDTNNRCRVMTTLATVCRRNLAMNANSSVEPWSCVNDKWRWVQCHSAPYCYGRTYLVKLGQYPDNYHVILKYFYTYKYATLFCHNRRSRKRNWDPLDYLLVLLVVHVVSLCLSQRFPRHHSA